MNKLILVAAVAASAVLIASAASAARPDPGCTTASDSLSVGWNYTVSAWGLPTGGTVNMIVTYPNGSTSTGPVSIASDGTYARTTSSTTATPVEQTGTYTYRFVGKVKWPQGTFNQSYASCSGQVG